MKNAFGVFLLLILFRPHRAGAYPNFIGFGYGSCAACHYNTQGNGPLTDYGRALFSQEIAARPFIPARITNEELAEKSQFVPGVELPSWLRPSMKYRGLWINQSPGGTRTVHRWIDMQKDVSLTMQLNDEGSFLVSLSYSELPHRADFYRDGKPVQGVSREHYVRFAPLANLSVALGLVDKVYGIRTGDHTAASRQSLGFGQNDQVHGGVFEWSAETWTADLHLFAGNLWMEKEFRQKGFSIMFEKDIAEKNRLGFSLTSFSTEALRAERVAIHDRWGLPGLQGSALLAEFGFKRDRAAATALTKTGSYAMIETTLQLARGAFFLTGLDRTQDEMKPSSVDKQRWTIGLLSFPFQRTEFRLMYVQSKGFSTETATQDQNAVQGQIHVSL